MEMQKNKRKPKTEPTPHQKQFINLSLDELISKTNVREIIMRIILNKHGNIDITEDRITSNIQALHEQLYKVSKWGKYGLEDLKFINSNEISPAENESASAPKSVNAPNQKMNTLEDKSSSVEPQPSTSKNLLPTPISKDQFLQMSLDELLLKTNIVEIYKKLLLTMMDSEEITEERIKTNIEGLYRLLKYQHWQYYWNKFGLDDLRFVSSNEVSQAEYELEPKRKVNALEAAKASPSNKKHKQRNIEPSDFQKEILELDFDDFVSKTNITDIIEREYREKYPNQDQPLPEENREKILNVYYKRRYRTEEWWQTGMKNLKFRQCDCKRQKKFENKEMQCEIVETRNQGLQCFLPGINVGVECRPEKPKKRNIKIQCERINAQVEQVPTRLINKVAEVRMTQFRIENNSEKHSERIGQDPLDFQMSSHANVLQNVLTSPHACEVMPQSVVDEREFPNANHSTSIFRANELMESEEQMSSSNTLKQAAIKGETSSNSTLETLRNHESDVQIIEQSGNYDIIIISDDDDDDDETPNTQNNGPAVADDSNVPVGRGAKENSLVIGASASLQEPELKKEIVCVSTQTKSATFLSSQSIRKQPVTPTKSTEAAVSQTTPENLFTSTQKAQPGDHRASIKNEPSSNKPWEHFMASGVQCLGSPEEFILSISDEVETEDLFRAMVEPDGVNEIAASNESSIFETPKTKTCVTKVTSDISSIEIDASVPATTEMLENHFYDTDIEQELAEIFADNCVSDLLPSNQETCAQSENNKENETLSVQGTPNNSETDQNRYEPDVVRNNNNMVKEISGYESVVVPAERRTNKARFPGFELRVIKEKTKSKRKRKTADDSLSTTQVPKYNYKSLPLVVKRRSVENQQIAPSVDRIEEDPQFEIDDDTPPSSSSYQEEFIIEEDSSTDENTQSQNDANKLPSTTADYLLSTGNSMFLQINTQLTRDYNATEAEAEEPIISNQLLMQPAPQSNEVEHSLQLTSKVSSQTTCFTQLTNLSNGDNFKLSAYNLSSISPEPPQKKRKIRSSETATVKHQCAASSTIATKRKEFLFKNPFEMHGDHFEFLYHVDIKKVSSKAYIERTLTADGANKSNLLKQIVDIKLLLGFQCNGSNLIELNGDSPRKILKLTLKEWAAVQEIMCLIRNFTLDTRADEPVHATIFHRALYYLFKTTSKFSNVYIEYRDEDLEVARVLSSTYELKRSSRAHLASAIDPYVLQRMEYN